MTCCLPAVRNPGKSEECNRPDNTEIKRLQKGEKQSGCLGVRKGEGKDN